ncbi:hypothetical protein [Nocardioides campestrisoli]|uniref:hypothetical protein n=1 Tax=Nocardioides campestrisoli TaxID=2736757 RepID=UPI00163DB3CF|nr:hypothetical protein [Nocardioides campestrisoli]
MNHTGQDEGGAEEVGTLGEETVRLLGSLAGWVREHGADLGHGLEDAAEHVADSWREADEHLATGAPECQVCPVCRAVQAARSVSPEVKGHLASAATHLLSAATSLLAAQQAGPSTGPATGPSRVEHIDLGEDWPEDRPEDRPEDKDTGTS